MSMSTQPAEAPMVFAQAARTLAAVTVDSYNEELREADGFVGDRASGRAFRKILDDCRARLEKAGHEDPFGDVESKSISKSKLDKVLAGKDPLAAGAVHTAVEEFAQELAGVVRRFLKVKSWANTEHIVIGGGLIASHIGQLAMGRAAVLVSEHVPIKFSAITHHPDEAGLVGSVELAPTWVLKGHDGMLAVDIGGTNIRAGLIRMRLKDGEVTRMDVVKRLHWRHGEEKPTREEAVDRIGEMLSELIELAETEKMKLAPFVGIACPGLIDEQGAILRGGQNLPGNWESKKFNLPAEIGRRLGRIDGHEVAVVMHNDAVVQGLSEAPNMRDVKHWSVMTIGTGLGNAHFTTRDRDAEEKARKKDKEKAKEKDKDKEKSKKD